MKRKTIICALLIFFAVIFLNTTVSLAETTPAYDFANNFFYTNGTPVTIEEINGDTKIVWEIIKF